MSRRLQLERLSLKSVYLESRWNLLTLFNTQDAFTYIELHATGEFRRTGGMLANIARCVIVRGRGSSKIREVPYATQ